MLFAFAEAWGGTAPGVGWAVRALCRRTRTSPSVEASPGRRVPQTFLPLVVSFVARVLF